jgi:hypothetical protein
MGIFLRIREGKVNGESNLWLSVVARGTVS